MSATVSQITNEKIKEILTDIGFSLYESYPGWAYDLADRLVDAGWEKKEPSDGR